MRKLFLSVWIGGMLILLTFHAVYSQNQNLKLLQTPGEKYLIGEEKKLEIIVHIWGEVKLPGEKRVPDGTNILELISKAGGPTEYSDLSNVMLFSDRTNANIPLPKPFQSSQLEKFVIDDMNKLKQEGKVEININKYLKKNYSKYLPGLLPGDVVHVKRNVWYKWQTLIRVVSQVAIIAQVWYWYSRIN